jgi:1,4-alpha-glucan branching enzyme
MIMLQLAIACLIIALIAAVLGFGGIGVAFRVWAPHAEAVCVTGSFNDWSADAHPMAHEEGGYWYADIASASVGDEYRYRIVNGDKQLLRIDPYARQVTSSVGNAVVADPHFDWDGDDFHLPAVNELVIYECTWEPSTTTRMESRTSLRRPSRNSTICSVWA